MLQGFCVLWIILNIDAGIKPWIILCVVTMLRIKDFAVICVDGIKLKICWIICCFLCSGVLDKNAL